MSEWQPIETAPKDVRFIAYYIGYKRPFIAWWNVADQCFESDSTVIMNDGPENPTHWMPLPPPPDRK